MGINAVKGVEIGAGFASVEQMGTEHSDEMTPQGFVSNNAGGILGGISTGQDVVVSIAIKPTSSIRLPRKTVGVWVRPRHRTNGGRPCVGIRATPIADGSPPASFDHALPSPQNATDGEDPRVPGRPGGRRGTDRRWFEDPDPRKTEADSYNYGSMTLHHHEKLWDSHFVREEPDGTALLYIDRHLVHEVTSPQAFEGLALHARKPWRIGSVVATADHNVPTQFRDQGIADPISRLQVETLDQNVVKFHVKTYFGMKDHRQGIVHVIGPEQGATLPGMTVVCGDSHTSTHGAFAALAFGIGTSEVEHVLARNASPKGEDDAVRAAGDLPAV